MVSKTITFNYRYEIDIYFAEKIMKKAREFESKIQMECDGRGLTSLSRLKLSCLIKMGSKVTIYADGIDEKEALEAISSLLEIVAEAFGVTVQKLLDPNLDYNRVENGLPEGFKRYDNILLDDIQYVKVKQWAENNKKYIDCILKKSY